jgi:hypothetical protein
MLLHLILLRQKVLPWMLLRQVGSKECSCMQWMLGQRRSCNWCFCNSCNLQQKLSPLRMALQRMLQYQSSSGNIRSSDGVCWNQIQVVNAGSNFLKFECFCCISSSGPALIQDLFR